MSKMVAAKCRLCRRAKEKLFLKGVKCLSTKCPQVRRPFVPGQHGPTQRGRLSDYGTRLREKQKARQIYGLTEGQFENYFDEATQLKGIAGSNLLILLERRLDNVIYRIGMSPSRRGAKQLVRHGSILVNGRKVDVPSFKVKNGDAVAVTEKASPRVLKQAQLAVEKKAPGWLDVSDDRLAAKVTRLPQREDIDTNVDVQMIIEYYSR
jgi:small subunit ribosomal protein S4